MHREWTREGYLISTDPARLDVAAIHRYLSGESYWARNIPLPLLTKALSNSRCYGIYGPDAVGAGPRAVPDAADPGPGTVAGTGSSPPADPRAVSAFPLPASSPPLAGFGRRLAGFGRLVTDYATFAYVGDVFVLPAHRGRGLSKWLVECMLADPEVQGLRNWTLYTDDAQSLYARYGFRHPEDPATVMAIKRKNPYGAPVTGNGSP